MPLRIRVQRIPDGFDCHVSIGDITIGAASGDAVSALNAASGLALDLSKAMESHPELAMLMPPQATAALKAIRIASWAAKNGKLPEVAKKIPGAARAVASVLKAIL